MSQAIPSALRGVRAIFFDLDNTLWAADPVLLRAEQKQSDWLQLNYPKISERFPPVTLRHLRQEVLDRHPEIAHDLSQVRLRTLRAAALSCGYPESVARECFEVFFAARNEVVLFPDVIPALKRLRTRLVVGSLTNGNASLEIIGVAEHFDHRLAAGDLGQAKPHPESFIAACRAAGMAPNTVAYVGDDPKTDVGGAIEAGLIGIWMNREHHPWTEPFDPVATVHNMEQLCDLMLSAQSDPS